MSQLKLTWKQFEKDMQSLIKMIPKNKYNKLLLVSKGGLIPGYYLAKAFGIDLVSTICVSSYEEGNESGPVKFYTSNSSDDSGWLIVDDLIDSADTIKAIKEKMPKADVAVLYVKDHKDNVSMSGQTYYVKKAPSDWIVFPWEI